MVGVIVGDAGVDGDDVGVVMVIVGFVVVVVVGVMAAVGQDMVPYSELMSSVILLQVPDWGVSTLPQLWHLRSEHH